MGEELFNENFRASETVLVQSSVGDTLALLKNSCPFFLHFFLGEELTHKVPDFHIDTWALMNNQTLDQIACALPRGTAKTTLARLSVIYHWMFTPKRFAIYISDTHAAAAESCKVIIDFLKSENFEALFGPCRFDVEQDSRGFYKFILPYYDGQGILRNKYCILKALGAGQQIRGMNIDNVRPEIAIVDDLESDENTATKILRTNLKKWFYGAFIKALTRKQPKIIFIGNMLSSESLLYHFCENSTAWHTIRYGILRSDGACLWPAIWNMEQIKKDFLEYQQLGLIGKWFAEMMNMPIPDGGGLINSDDIFYRPVCNPGEQEAAFLTVDPAISQKTYADETAISVHGLVGGTWQLVDYVKGKFTPDQLFMLLLDMKTKWRTNCVGIEMAGYQAVLKYLFDILMQVHQQSFMIYEIPHRNKSKTERLMGWCSLIRKKQYALFEGDFAMTEQLLQYDLTKKENRDDLIDSGSMFVTMSEMYMPAIMDSYDIDPGRWRITHVVTH